MTAVSTISLKNKLLLYPVFVLFLGLLALPGWAAQGLWQDNGVLAAPHNAGGGGRPPSIVTDGTNGVIVVSHYSNTIYAQRITDGYPAWIPHTGVTVYMSASPATIENPQAVSDNSGGAIIAWHDGRNTVNYNVYAQRINGSIQWGSTGVAIRNLSGSSYDIYSLQMIPDGTGGAIIAWRDHRSTTRYDLYVQRVNNSGVVQWTANGVAIYTLSPDNQSYNYDLVSDGSNGVILVWQDARSTNPNPGIYAQRVNSAGTVQWTANGICVATEANIRRNPALIPDGSGGALIVWEDSRSGNYDIYSQRINSSGVPQWTANGVAVCLVAPTDQGEAKLASDGSSGAFIAWTDPRNSPMGGIYAQRINSAGVSQWTTNGISIRTNAYTAYTPQVVYDAANGAIISWLDQRPSNINNNPSYAYVQRVDNSGNVKWLVNGIPLTDLGGFFYYDVIADNSGGAILGWGVTNGAYVQRILKPKPRIMSINSPALYGTNFHASISGADFQDDRGAVSAVKLTRTASADILASNLVVAHANSITCDFDLSSATLGDWYLVLTDSLSQKSMENVVVSVVQPTGTPTPTSTITPTFTVTPVLTPTPTLTITPTLIPTSTPISYSDFEGQIISKNYIYAAPNPIQGSTGRIFVYCKQRATGKIKIFTLLGQEVLSIERSFQVGRNVENIYMGNLANAMYYLFVRVRNDEGLEEKAKTKIILLK